MCGRYTVTTVDGIIDDLIEQLDRESLARPPWFEARYNAAPTQELPIAVDRGEGVSLEPMRWGLIPHWAKDVSVGARMINARSETLADKPAFRDAYARRRCLVLADGFFEWRRDGKSKIPMWYHRADRRGFAFAGLWASWRSPRGERIASFTIVTAPPNPLLAPYHDRMPVIVAPADYARWLHPALMPPEMTADILATPSPEGYELTDVSPRVNRVDNDDPACLEPYKPIQPSLF